MRSLGTDARMNSSSASDSELRESMVVGPESNLMSDVRREASSAIGPTFEDSVAGVPHPEPRDRARVLVTIPVHNEVHRLTESLARLDSAFRSASLDYQLSVAEDGSTDGTKDLLHQLTERWPGITIQEDLEPLGRGRALRRLWSRSQADVYCFTDADLATGPESVVTVVRKVVEGAPIVIGSRYVDGATTNRPPLRSLVSREYNRLLRFAFRQGTRDHQCGLKAFSGGAIRQLLPRTKEDSWFWDTEIVVLALLSGIPVMELPVSWVEHKGRRTPIRRLVSDIFLHGTGLLRLKSRVRDGDAAPHSASLPVFENAPSSRLHLAHQPAEYAHR